MTFARFDSGKAALEDLLRQAQIGKLQLPDFQRGWVWDDYGIRSLIASISQSFPVGALMQLKTGGEVSFKPRPIQGRDETVPLYEPEFLLLDGQQRITSLYQACFQNQVIETTNAQRRRIKRWYYVDMTKAVDPTIDREEAIVGVPEDKIIRSDFGRKVELDLSTREKEFAACMFPLNRVFDERKWEEGFEDYWDNRDKRRFYRHFRDTIIEAFRQYNVPVITLGQETPKEAVCLVFEKVNTGGKKLDAFELLTAIYAAEDFNLRHDWLGDPESKKTGRRERLAQFDVLRELASVDFLQAVSLLHTYETRMQQIDEGREGKDLTPVSCTRQTVLNLPLA